MVTLSRPNLIWYQRSTTECLVWVKSMEGPCKYWQNTHFVTIKNCKAVLLTIRDGSVITKLCAAVARYPQRESSKILNVSHRWRKNPLFKRLLDRWEKESVNFREQEIRILLLSALFYYGAPPLGTSNIFFSSEHKKTISEGNYGTLTKQMHLIFRYGCFPHFVLSLLLTKHWRF